jgi:O-methyltransferase involved in polyketide biosynthesis
VEAFDAALATNIRAPYFLTAAAAAEQVVLLGAGLDSRAFRLGLPAIT